MAKPRRPVPANVIEFRPRNRPEPLPEPKRETGEEKLAAMPQFVSREVWRNILVLAILARSSHRDAQQAMEALGNIEAAIGRRL